MNKYKKLAFNTVIFAIGNFGAKILNLLLTRLYSTNLDETESGTKGLLELSLLFLQPIFTLALQEYLIRFGLDKEYDKREVFSTSALITSAGMGLMALTVPFLQLIPALDYMKGYTVLLILYVAVSSFRMLCQNFVRSIDKVKLFSIDGILATLSLLIFNLIFIAGLHMGVKGFLFAAILSDTLSVIFLFFTADLRKFTDKDCINKELAEKMLRFAAPLIPTIVMWAITSLSDRLFIKAMHSDRVQLGLGAAGIYDYANKIPSLISMVSTIFFQAWSMSAITENSSADRNNFYSKVYSAYESVLFMASAGLFLIIRPVTSFIVPAKTYSVYETVYLYTPVLVVAVIFMCLNQFLGSIYSATKHSKNSFWTALVACTVNLIMNYALIPAWGIQGAAIATLLSYLICFWVRIIDARYYVPFDFSMVKSLINTGILLVMAAIVIKAPPLSIIWLLLLCCTVIGLNYKAIIMTVKKLLKRS